MRNSRSLPLKPSAFLRATSSTPKAPRRCSMSDGPRRINQTATPEAPREGKIGGADVAFVQQLATNAAAQSIVVELDLRQFGEADLGCALRAVRANPRHGQLALDRVILAQAREVDIQVIFETTYHHREDAGEVLAFSDGVGSLLQQAQPAELVECLALGQLARGRFGAQREVASSRSVVRSRTRSSSASLTRVRTCSTRILRAVSIEPICVTVKRKKSQFANLAACASIEARSAGDSEYNMAVLLATASAASKAISGARRSVSRRCQ